MRQKLRTILVTGGAGFIGSEFVRQIARTKRYHIIVIDKLTYAGDLARLNEVEKSFIFHKCDIARAAQLGAIFDKEKPDMIVHFAAETHVDRSLVDSDVFIKNNIIGTQNLIQQSLKHKIKRFIHISTDEVYGQRPTGRFKETDPLQPRNPYSATKASAELLVRAAVETFQLPAMIVRPANNYGHWQYPEKFIPVAINKALNNQTIPVYGRGKQIREWLHVSDCAAAIHTILMKGTITETYNIGSRHEGQNIQTARTILNILSKPESLIQFVKDRPGHDFRYGVNDKKLRQLGWTPKITFHKGLRQTVDWYQNHQLWLTKKTKYLEEYRAKIGHNG